MRVYETTFVVNPQTDDSTIDQHVASVADVITNQGGRMLREDRMGTRRLAYPIKKLTQGYYHTFVYEAPEKLQTELDRYFRLNDQYLRHLTILFEGDPAELKARSQEPEARAEAKPEPAEKPEEKPDEGPERVTVAQSVPPSQQEEAAPAEAAPATEPAEEESGEASEETTEEAAEEATGDDESAEEETKQE